MQLDYSLCNNVHDSQYGHYTQRNWLCWLMAVRGIIRIYGQVFITWKPSHDCYFTVFLTDDVLLICVISSRDQLNSLPILAHHRYFFLHDITVYSFCTCNAMIYLQHIKNVHVLSSHEVSSAHHKKKTSTSTALFFHLSVSTKSQSKFRTKSSGIWQDRHDLSSLYWPVGDISLRDVARLTSVRFETEWIYFTFP